MTQAPPWLERIASRLGREIINAEQLADMLMTEQKKNEALAATLAETQKKDPKGKKP